MKRSHTWFALILIASVLIPSAARSDLPRPSVQSRGCLTHQRNNESKYAQSDTQPTALPNISQAQESAKPVSSQSAAQNIRDNRSSGESPIVGIWIAGITAQGFFNFVIAFATVLLAIFTWKLVRVTRDMHTVSVEATNVSKDSVEAAKENVRVSQANVTAANAQAEAAKQSAKAAEMALTADRPYLLLTDFNVWNVVPESEQEADPFKVPAVECVLKNFGKGPAVLTRVIGRWEVGKDFSLPPDFSACMPLYTFKDRIIAPDGTTSFIVVIEGFRIADQIFQDFTEGKIAFLLRGIVYYQDVFKKDYEIQFGRRYTCGISEFKLKEPHFIAGPLEYNTFT